MFPLRDENPTFRASVITFAIILGNIAVWVLVQGLGLHPRLEQSVWQLGLVPARVLGTATAAFPVSEQLEITFGSFSNWATIFTAMFMHGGWLHLLGNMWFLYLFGDNVEDVMGRVRFVIFYLVCGTAAAATQMWADPASTIPMVGASGAIGGVMGAYAILFPRAPVHMVIFLGFYVSRIAVPAFFMLGYWFIIQIISSMAPTGSSQGGVAFWAHIGGFLAGIILARILCISSRLDEYRKRRGRTDHMVRQVSRGW